MPVWQTVLIYVIAPLFVALVLASLTLPGGRKRPRWKSGQAWPHEPVWYEPHPEALGHPAAEHDVHQGGGDSALPPGHGPAAILDAGTETRALTAGAENEPQPASVGPLGGARGTW